MTTLGQAYQTRTQNGDLLDRRRLTEWIDLRAGALFDLPALRLAVSFRLDLDLGTGIDAPGAGELAELLTATLEATDLLGCLDVSLGRNLTWDELGFLAYDGVQATVRLPGALALRLLTGLEVRDRSWLAGAALELEDTDDTAPAAVVALGLALQAEQVQAELTYRRVVLWEEGWPLDAEHLAGALTLQGFGLMLSTGAAYHLALDRFDRVRLDASLKEAGPSAIRAELGGLYEVPSFSLDSIWNFLSPAPFFEVHGGLRARPALGLALRLAVFHRAYETEAGAIGDQATGIDVGSHLWIGQSVNAGLRATFETGAAGLRLLLVPSVASKLGEDFDLDGRLLLHGLRDPARPAFDSLTLGGSASLGWRFGRSRRLSALVEANHNSQNPLTLRALAVLDLAFAFGEPP